MVKLYSEAWRSISFLYFPGRYVKVCTLRYIETEVIIEYPTRAVRLKRRAAHDQNNKIYGIYAIKMAMCLSLWNSCK